MADPKDHPIYWGQSLTLAILFMALIGVASTTLGLLTWIAGLLTGVMLAILAVMPRASEANRRREEARRG